MNIKDIIRFKRGTIRFKELASRLTGFSTPVFGVSWDPPEPERDIVRRLITILEDRRALFNPFELEIEEQVVESVVRIRGDLTTALSDLPDGAPAGSPIRAMRAACRKFLDSAPYPEFHHFGKNWRPGNQAGFCVALGELRAAFGMQLALLAVEYGIDIERNLASILPAEDGE